MIEITAFRWVPEFAQGYVRDLPVRWALEEAGLPYRVRLLGREDLGKPAYRALQPFGQVPSLTDGDIRQFESGAIVLHVAEQAEALLPRDPIGRAQTIQWMVAALNTIEPPIQQHAALRVFPDPTGTAAARLPAAEAHVRKRLGELAVALGAQDHLCGTFTAADILMTSILRIADDSGLVEEQPTLATYRDRCMARPAFQKALAAQLADFVTTS